MKIVKNKTELKKAVKEGEKEIVVVGDFAEKLYKGKKITKYGKLPLVLLAGALAGIPATGGLSLAAAAPIAALTGIEVAPIIVAVSIGLTLLLSVWSGYEEVEYSYPPAKLKLGKKAKKVTEKKAKKQKQKKI